MLQRSPNIQLGDSLLLADSGNSGDVTLSAGANDRPASAPHRASRRSGSRQRQVQYELERHAFEANTLTQMFLILAKKAPSWWKSNGGGGGFGTSGGGVTGSFPASAGFSSLRFSGLTVAAALEEKKRGGTRESARFCFLHPYMHVTWFRLGPWHTFR